MRFFINRRGGLCCSKFHRLDLVIDFQVQRVEVADEIVLAEGHFGCVVTIISFLESLVESVPLVIKRNAILWGLLVLELFGFRIFPLTQIYGLVECHWIDLFENRFEGDQRFLKNLVPMRVS